MIPSDSTILAVGAAGKFAGLVVPELAKRGARVRGLVRNAKQGKAVIKSGAVEVAVGDLNDRASLKAALKGVDSVFYIAPAFIPNEVEIGQGMVAAAQQAGVRRFVFSSVIDPIIDALVNHAAKGPVEEAILSSNMEYTFLHPTLFFQNYAEGWPTVVKTGSYAEPWSAETRFSRVDYRDVAEVAAIALTEDRLIFGTFELCAEGHLNRKDAVALMSEVLGRKIEAANLSPGQIAEISKGNGLKKERSPIKAMFDWYDVHDLVGNPLILRAILGREPRTLRAYFEELAVGTRTPHKVGARKAQKHPKPR
jgi:uncharacterized protein YbjT (DUF2867 family)